MTGILFLLIPIIALVGGYYTTIQKEKYRAQAKGGSSPEVRRLLDESLAEQDRLRARVEALEAIVTDDGFDLARDARRAGVGGRLSAHVVSGALADPPHPTASESADVARRARTT